MQKSLGKQTTRSKSQSLANGAAERGLGLSVGARGQGALPDPGPQFPNFSKEGSGKSDLQGLFKQKIII